MATLKVLVADPATGALSLGLPSPPQYVSDIDLLVQIIVLDLLNNGGRSITEPDKGGGLRTLIGINIDPDDPSEIMADVRMIVSRVEQRIKEKQVSTGRPPSERLSTLQLIDVSPDSSADSVLVYLGVINEEEQVSQAMVALR